MFRIIARRLTLCHPIPRRMAASRVNFRIKAVAGHMNLTRVRSLATLPMCTISTQAVAGAVASTDGPVEITHPYLKKLQQTAEYRKNQAHVFLSHLKQYAAIDQKSADVKELIAAVNAYIAEEGYTKNDTITVLAWGHDSAAHVVGVMRELGWSIETTQSDRSGSTVDIRVTFKHK